MGRCNESDEVFIELHEKGEVGCLPPYELGNSQALITEGNMGVLVAERKL